MTKKVDEFIAHIKSLSDEELRELATTPEWALFMHKLYGIRPGESLTVERIEMDALIHQQYQCSTEYYAAQVELNRERFEYQQSRL
jgi:hypothetical protein